MFVMQVKSEQKQTDEKCVLQESFVWKMFQVTNFQWSNTKVAVEKGFTISVPNVWQPWKVYHATAIWRK